MNKKRSKITVSSKKTLQDVCLEVFLMYSLFVKCDYLLKTAFQSAKNV